MVGLALVGDDAIMVGLALVDGDAMEGLAVTGDNAMVGLAVAGAGVRSRSSLTSAIPFATSLQKTLFSTVGFSLSTSSMGISELSPTQQSLSAPGCKGAKTSSQEIDSSEAQRQLSDVVDTNCAFAKCLY